MMEYKEIDRVNSEIKMLNLKGKDYAMVPERVTAFRKLFPDGFIKTEVVSHTAGQGGKMVVMMKACAGYYRENGEAVVMGTGFAQEIEGRGMVNGTSYIENCETSAVGRALGFLGLGLNGGGICSAEELTNAIVAQNQMKNEAQNGTQKPFTPPAVNPGGNVVSTSSRLPDVNQEPEKPKEITPGKKYLLDEVKKLREARGMAAGAHNKLFAEQRKELIEKGLAPDKSLEEYTIEEAKELIRLIYEKFPVEQVEGAK